MSETETQTTETQDAPELTIEAAAGWQPDQIDDTQREFLESKAEELDDETAKKFGIEKPLAPVIPEPRKVEEPAPPSASTKPDDELTDEEIAAKAEEARINKIVDSKLAPQRQAIAEQRNITEVDDFLRSNADKLPNVGKYRDAMLTTMKTPGFERLTAQHVFNIVAGAELMRIGAAKERAAAGKAKGTQTKTSSAGRSAPGKKDWSKATPEEFKAEKLRVLGRQGN